MYIIIALLGRQIFVQHDISKAELNSYTCRTLESSFIALATNTLHSFFSYQLPKNSNLRLAIADSAVKQLHIYWHESTHDITPTNISLCR